MFTITSLGGTEPQTVFSVASTAKLVAGMVIKFESSTGQTRTGLAKIASVDSGTQFTVVRNHASSTLANISIGDKFRTTLPRLEGSEPIVGTNTQQTSEYNYTEITDATIRLTKTALATAKNGNANQVQEQIRRALIQMQWKELNIIMHHYRQVGSDSEASMLGGMEYFMQNGNNESTGGALSSTHLNNAFSMIYEKAGQLRPNLAIVLAPNQQQRLSAFNTSGTNPLSTIDYGSASTGTYVNKFIENLTGSQTPTFVEPNMPKDQIWIVDFNAMQRVYLRRPTSNPVSISADAEQYRIIMEHGFKMRNGKERFARITGLTV
jgi:hypothetical protein